MKHDNLMDIMADEFISALVDKETDGEGIDIEKIIAEYAEQNDEDYDELRRMYGDELISRGLL